MAPPPNERWIQLAEKIRAEVQRAAHGRKAKIFQRYAAETGYHPASLRRDVMALGAIRRHETTQPEFARNLRKLGSTTVLELSRLHAKRPDDAEAAARAAVKGGLTVRALVARRPQREKSDHRTAIRNEALEFIASVRSDFRLRLSLEDAIEFERGEAIAFRLVDGSDVCFGYRALSGYRPTEKHLMDFIALAVLHRRVYLGIDRDALPGEWQSTLQKVGSKGLSLTIFGRGFYGWERLWGSDN
jgi:hypothetical protein